MGRARACACEAGGGWHLKVAPSAPLAEVDAAASSAIAERGRGGGWQHGPHNSAQKMSLPFGHLSIGMHL